MFSTSALFNTQQKRNALIILSFFHILIITASNYLWAEVLSADAFSLFEEQGIFNPQTGQAFLDHILTRGGSEEPMELFKRFRGREPQL
ncbi:M3 family metallopeptidase, partial [Testudinibacter sp. TR-2022]|uniref:M3 family metallopeptidase n=1 Tax=Testudinibacter sp. TR-2022 TaxID=2585029 RepID=UPI002278A6FE